MMGKAHEIAMVISPLLTYVLRINHGVEAPASKPHPCIGTTKLRQDQLIPNHLTSPLHRRVYSLIVKKMGYRQG